MWQLEPLKNDQLSHGSLVIYHKATLFWSHVKTMQSGSKHFTTTCQSGGHVQAVTTCDMLMLVTSVPTAANTTMKAIGYKMSCW